MKTPESFNANLDNGADDIFGTDLVEVGGDIAGFWSPREGEAIRCQFVTYRTDIPTAYGTPCVVGRIVRGIASAIRAEGEEIRLSTGDTIGIWESFDIERTLRPLVDFAPEFAIQYLGDVPTKTNRRVKRYRVSVSRDALVAQRQLASGAPARMLDAPKVEGQDR